jgi:glycosyltransferase involved in cell wall biosynthesis
MNRVSALPEKSILILTYRNLDAGGGASYRTTHIAKYLSRFFNVLIVDGWRNTYIVAKHGSLKRRIENRSRLSILLSYIPLIFNRFLNILGFPREEVGRLTSILDLGLFYDALRVSLKAKPFLIIVEEYYSLIVIAFLLKKIFKVKYLILDLHNIDTLRLLRYPNINKIFLKLIYVLERKAFNTADLIIVVSDRDMHFAKKIFNNVNSIVVVPNFVSYSELETMKHGGLGELEEVIRDEYIVFHGDFRYYPNREALFNLLKHIMPRIWELYPTIKLVIMGPGLPQFLGERVISLGYVSQKTLYRILCNAGYALVPLLRGGGTRIKILEYMACGVPVISTRVGAEGLSVENFKHIVLVDSIDEFPLMLKMLIENNELRERIKYNAVNLIKERYDIDKAMEKFIDICFKWMKSGD